MKRENYDAAVHGYTFLLLTPFSFGKLLKKRLMSCNCIKKYWVDTRSAFHLVKISGIFGSAVNGTRFVDSSHWKIPRKSGKSKKVGPFSRLEFPNGISRVPFTFLVVCTSSRSTVGHRDVPGFTTKWTNGTTFYQSEIPLLLSPKFPGFFPKWKAPLDSKLDQNIIIKWLSAFLWLFVNRLVVTV